MPLVPLPFRTHVCGYFRVDWLRVFRLAIIVGLVVAFAYFDYSQNSAVNREVSNWFDERDPLLRMLHPVNQSLRNSPESVPLIATVIIAVQYALYICLTFKFVGHGDLILFEIFFGWGVGLLTKYVMPLPRSSLAIDYSSNLPYPLQKYIDDVSFSTTTFMAIVCARHLTRSEKDYMGKLALYTVVTVTMFFLLATYNTNFYSLVFAILVSVLSSRCRSALAVKLEQAKNKSMEVLFGQMKRKARVALDEVARNGKDSFTRMFDLNGLVQQRRVQGPKADDIDLDDLIRFDEHDAKSSEDGDTSPRENPFIDDAEVKVQQLVPPTPIVSEFATTLRVIQPRDDHKEEEEEEEMGPYTDPFASLTETKTDDHSLVDL